MIKVMKTRISYFSVLVILLSVLVSCTKKPETIVSELYSSIYNEDWEKVIPMIIHDSIGNLNSDEIKLLGKEFGRYFPKGSAYESLKVDSATYSEDKNEIEYTVTVHYNDSTSFTEKGNLKKNADGVWKLADYMPKGGEKIPFEITFDFPLEMKPNLKRAMIMVGAERKMPKYQYYAAPYYFFAPYPVDKEKFESLLKDASDGGYQPAMLQLAKIYYSKLDNRTGKVIMFDQYLELMKKAATMGNLEAKAILAWYQREGSYGYSKDLEAARKAFQEAYDAGISEGAYGLGYMYGQGEIGPQDRAKALEYYKKAAELGNLDAAFNVYFYYSKGWGVKRDVEKGRKLEQEYRDKAIGFDRSLYEPDNQKINFETTLLKIKHGDPSGYLYKTLGNCYEFGKGVDQDIEKAKWCYRRDAALSSDISKEDMIRGRGFETNPVIPIEEIKEIYK